MTNSKKIPLAELKIGMYVLSIVTNDKDVNMKSQGYILKEESITHLKKSHVSHVVIDLSKMEETATDNETAIKTASRETSKKAAEKPHHSASFDSEIKKAKAVYDNAKALQKKVLNDITQNKVIDTAVIKESTNAIVDSVFRNEDALSCLTQLKVKDDYLLEHSLNVSILIAIFCKHLNIEEMVIKELTLGAFLHDIGKIRIPDYVLNKPGKLTETEYAIMKQHVLLGIKVLEETPGISERSMLVVKEHHERMNGTGYPYALSEHSISQFGKMIAIVDSYDAMTAERVYKAGMHPINAFKILVKESPNCFDKTLVEQFIQCLGLYPVGTLVKLTSGKIGLISQVNANKPLQPVVNVFYNARLKQAVAIESIDLSKAKYNDKIDCCIKPDEFNLDLVKFFTTIFIE